MGVNYTINRQYWSKLGRYAHRCSIKIIIPFVQMGSACQQIHVAQSTSRRHGFQASIRKMAIIVKGSRQNMEASQSHKSENPDFYILLGKLMCMRTKYRVAHL